MKYDEAPVGFVANIGTENDRLLIVKSRDSGWRYVETGNEVPLDRLNRSRFNEYIHEKRVVRSVPTVGTALIRDWKPSCARCIERGHDNFDVVAIAKETSNGNFVGDFLCAEHSDHGAAYKQGVQDAKAVQYRRGLTDGRAATQEFATCGDKLAAAAANVLVEEDGTQRLRVALTNWFNLRVDHLTSHTEE